MSSAPTSWRKATPLARPVCRADFVGTADDGGIGEQLVDVIRNAAVAAVLAAVRCAGRVGFGDLSVSEFMRGGLAAAMRMAERAAADEDAQ